MVGALKRRRTGSQLLAYRASDGWRDLTAEEVNAYLKQCSGGEFTAKDFRTWNATVLAAVALASAEEVRGKAAHEREVKQAIKTVAAYLGNTPAVCRASYVDPRVIDRFQAGVTIAAAIGRAGRILAQSESPCSRREGGTGVARGCQRPCLNRSRAPVSEMLTIWMACSAGLSPRVSSAAQQPTRRHRWRLLRTTLLLRIRRSSPRAFARRRAGLLGRPRVCRRSSPPALVLRPRIPRQRSRGRAGAWWLSRRWRSSIRRRAGARRAGRCSARSRAAWRSLQGMTVWPRSRRSLSSSLAWLTASTSPIISL